MSESSYTIPAEQLLVEALQAYQGQVPGAHASQREPRVSYLRKLWNERQIRKRSDALFTSLEPYRAKDPADWTDTEQVAVRGLVSDYLRSLDAQRSLYSESFLAFFLDEGFLDTAEAFIRRSRREDSVLEEDDVYQALRNVWIMNCLQSTWGLPVQLSDPVYAYSMLYPYTDNLLDDPTISSEDKAGFNQRLAERIRGVSQTAQESELLPWEQRVHELVGLIYSVYPPADYPQVQAALQLILEGQVLSLSQAEQADIETLLQLSFAKGGASVVADGMLVQGDLPAGQLQFAYHYGCFLQLIDDLQDIDEDTASGQQTIFARADAPELHDGEVQRLLDYISYCNRVLPGDTEMEGRMKGIIRHFSRLLVMEALAGKPELVSPAFYRELERSAPVRLSFFPRFEERIRAFMT